MPAIRDLEHVHIYTDADNFCAEASVVNLGNGEIVAVFIRNRGLRHTDSGTVLLVRSHDSGRTWEGARSLVVMPQEDDAGYNTAAISRLRDGTLLVHANRWRYLDDGEIDWWRGTSHNEGVYLCTSADNGHSWSTPQRVNIEPMRSAWVRDAILELEDGALLMPLHGLMLQLSIPEIPSAEKERSFVLCSRDKGNRWDYWGTVAIDPGSIIHFHEPGLIQLTDGRVLALVRTQRWPRQAGAGEQMSPPSGYTFACFSEDGGASWTWPRNTLLWGYPADPIHLPDGRMLVAYGHRRTPMGVRIAVSRDGLVWEPNDGLTIAEYDVTKVTPAFHTYYGESLASRQMRGLLWHIGYPTSTLLDDGRVLTAYHLFNQQGRQCIEGSIYRLV